MPFGAAKFIAMRMKIEQHFREPNPTEAEFMQRLLAADFPGKEEIAKQLTSCRVRIIDSEGSLALELSDAARPAAVEKRFCEAVWIHLKPQGRFTRITSSRHPSGRHEGFRRTPSQPARSSV